MANHVTYRNVGRACSNDILLPSSSLIMNYRKQENYTPLSMSTYTTWSENSKTNYNWCNENNGKPAKQTA